MCDVSVMVMRVWKEGVGGGCGEEGVSVKGMCVGVNVCMCMKGIGSMRGMKVCRGALGEG